MPLKDVKPSDLGRKQFYEHQTTGKILKRPGVDKIDDYFFVLQKGKEVFDLMTSEYKKMYDNGEWWGWFILREDWKGNRWLLPYLCSWYPRHTGRNLPDWISQED